MTYYTSGGQVVVEGAVLTTEVIMSIWEKIIGFIGVIKNIATIIKEVCDIFIKINKMVTEK